MKRILYIGAGTPWRGGAGFLVRQSLLLGALAEVAHLHLAMFDTDVNRPPPFDAEVTALPTPKQSRPGKIALLLADLFSPEPRMIRGYDLSAPRRTVASLHPDSFDAVFAYRIEFAHWAGVLRHPRLMLDVDDPEHIRAARRIQATTGKPPDWRTGRDLQKLRRFEQAAVGGAQLSLVCQEHDRQGWPRTPEVVPNCVEVPANPQRHVTEPRLLFVGNCAGGVAAPNVDAVLYFLSDIWPAVLRSAPAAQFQNVGAAGDAVRAAAAAVPQVQVSGFVDNLAAVYAASAASVVPIRFGTGTRIKILEAFAHACPVVSTPAGADGIDITPGQDIALATTASDFAAQCVLMLSDPQQRDRIGQAGHALATRHFDRGAQQERLAAMLQSQLGMLHSA